jgi:hypothetical protein
MTTKRETEILEQIISSMTENEYWGLVGWLGDGCDGPLWECLRPRRRAVLRSPSNEATTTP